MECIDLTAARPLNNSDGKSIYGPRVRHSLFRSFWTDGMGSGRVGLNIKRRDAFMMSELPDLKKELYGRMSIPIDKVRDPQFEKFTPMAARKDFVPIKVETFPLSSPASDISSIFSYDTYQNLKSSVLNDSGFCCQVCGGADKDRPTYQEIWNYTLPVNDELYGVQKLVNILCVCRACKAMFKTRPSENGLVFGDNARLMKLNCWSEDDLYIAFVKMNEDFKARNKCLWALDLSAFSKKTRFEINGSKWKVNREDNVYTSTDLKLTDGTSVRTKILNSECNSNYILTFSDV